MEKHFVARYSVQHNFATTYINKCKKYGNNYFRSAQILKSSYGADGIRVPLAFNGFCGQFTELPKRNDLSEKEYKELIDDVLTKKYFKT